MTAGQVRLAGHLMLALTMLIGIEGELWIHNTREPDEWQLYLLTRRH